jgi:DNA-binding transcriptional ArsR family regulator
MDRTPLHSTAPSSLPADRLLSLLGGRIRLAILRTLAQGPSNVGGISRRVGASIGLVSHNLRQLRDAGLVTRYARARERIYDLSPLTAVRSPDATILRLTSREGASIEVRLPVQHAAVVQTNSPLAQRVLEPAPHAIAS